MGKLLAWNSLFDKLFTFYSSLTSIKLMSSKELNKIQTVLGIPSSPALLLFSQCDYGGAVSMENVYAKLTKELI